MATFTLTLPSARREKTGVKLKDTVYILALQADDSENPEWGVWDRVLDGLVKMFQPSPVMTHVELMLPPSEATPATLRGVHFAAYKRQLAGWGEALQDKHSFYMLENYARWRAMPIVAQDAGEKVAAECERHVDTPYSLARYLASVPPGRAFAWALSDAPRAPGHCATVAARVLRSALPELELAHPAAWYGPATLFHELSGRTRAASNEQGMPPAIEGDDGVEKEVGELLLLGSEDAVKGLSHVQCAQAVERLTALALRARAGGKESEQKAAEEQLARALLRWTHWRHMHAKRMEW